MKVIIKFNDGTDGTVNLSGENQLENYDAITTNFRNLLVSKGELQFSNGVRKFDEVKSIEIVLD